MAPKKAPKSRSPQSTTEWMLWLRTVSVAEREAVADLLDGVEGNSYQDLQKLTRLIMSAMVRGDIPPSVCDSLHMWVDMLMHLNARIRGDSVGHNVTIHQLLMNAGDYSDDSPKPQPKYVTSGVPDFTDYEPKAQLVRSNVIEGAK